MPRDRRKIQHPLLGEVDPIEGPSALEEHERRVIPAVNESDPTEIIFPVPEPIPEPPSFLRSTRRILARGLRRLSRLADKLDKDG